MSSRAPTDAELAALLRSADVESIKRHGVLHGFRSSAWRQQFWPLACDIALPGAGGASDTGLAPSTPHAQVALDVPRSMHFDCTHTWGAAERDDAHARLARVLSAVFPAPSEDADAVAAGADAATPHYYQGAHDICSVLLLELGPAAAERLLRFLVCGGHLRGLVRPTMAPAIAELRLLLPLVAVADAQVHAALARHLASAGMDTPHFALPWVTTLFAHSVEALGPLGRLFDAFICGHPLLPIYVAAALLVHARERVLALGDDYGPAHSTLQALPRSLDSAAVTEEVIARAAALFERVPPDALVERAPADARATLRLQWPEAAAGSGTAWGGSPTPWLPSAVGPEGAVVAAAVVAAMAVGVALWRARAR